MPELNWNESFGRGFLDIVPRIYDEEYFDKYVGYEQTDIGEKITRARIDFVNAEYRGQLLDVGIGSGHFVATRPHTFGFDINEKGISWLTERNLYAEPLVRNFNGFSFFDSLEHIKEPAVILDSMNYGTKIFVSIPIFKDKDHVLRSKHYRPDEHYWYFTGLGFVRFMLDHGFHLLSVDDFEIRIGREDIQSFSFIKR